MVHTCVQSDVPSEGGSMEKWVRDLMHVHYGLDAQLLPEVVDHALIVCQVGCVIHIWGSLPCLPNEEQPVHMCIGACACFLERYQQRWNGTLCKSCKDPIKKSDMEAQIKLFDSTMQAA